LKSTCVQGMMLAPWQTAASRGILCAASAGVRLSRAATSMLGSRIGAPQLGCLDPVTSFDHEPACFVIC
jgi:hypothetical protein